MKNKETINCLLCSIYLYLNLILRIVFDDTYLNNIFTFIFIIVSFFNNYKNNKISKNFILISFFILFNFAFSFLFHSNYILNQEFINFIANGFIVMYFFDKVNDYNKFLTCLTYVCLGTFLFGAFDPLYDYRIFGSYMSYGLFCILPSFLLFHINRKFRKKSMFFVLELISCACLLFSNRNSILTALIAVVILDFFVVKVNLKKILKHFFLVFFSLLIIFKFNIIITFLVNKFGEKSYAIRSLYYSAIENATVLSGRDLIWEHAIFEIFNNPFGMGIGSFAAKYEYYSHNLLLDMFLVFGIIAIPIFSYIIYNILVKYKYYKDNVFYYFILIIAIIPLLFNTTFTNWNYFWIMILFISKKIRKKTNASISD